eukprot:jgi/Mesvir1/359/Mv18346-RA.1
MRVAARVLAPVPLLANKAGIEELLLHQWVVLRRRHLFPQHPFLYAHEWAAGNEGFNFVGDLLLWDGCAPASFLAVEVKWLGSSKIDHHRTEKLDKVKEQALKAEVFLLSYIMRKQFADTPSNENGRLPCPRLTADHFPPRWSSAVVTNEMRHFTHVSLLSPKVRDELQKDMDRFRASATVVSMPYAHEHDLTLPNGLAHNGYSHGHAPPSSNSNNIPAQRPAGLPPGSSQGVPGDGRLGQAGRGPHQGVVSFEPGGLLVGASCEWVQPSVEMEVVGRARGMAEYGDDDEEPDTRSVRSDRASSRGARAEGGVSEGEEVESPQEDGCEADKVTAVAMVLRNAVGGKRVLLSKMASLLASDPDICGRSRGAKGACSFKEYSGMTLKKFLLLHPDVFMLQGEVEKTTVQLHPQFLASLE